MAVFFIMIFSAQECLSMNVSGDKITKYALLKNNRGFI